MNPFEPFHNGGRYHIETSPLTCGTNQWTGFYMIIVFVMKRLIYIQVYATQPRHGKKSFSLNLPVYKNKTKQKQPENMAWLKTVFLTLPLGRIF